MKTKMQKLMGWGIIIPRKTACFNNLGIITSVKFVWINPLTYFYLFGSILYLCYIRTFNGKEYFNNLIK